jgi:hypothetical protein
MPDFRRGVDELEFDLLKILPASMGDQRLPKHEHFLLGAHAAALDHDVIVLDLTIMREPSHGGDILLGRVVHGRRIVSAAPALTLAHPVYFLVELSPVVVAELAGPCDCPGHSGRMPGSDAAYFTVTPV